MSGTGGGYYNATCRIVEPFSGPNADLSRVHGEDEGEEVRCSMRKRTMGQEANVFGEGLVNAWVCRVQTKKNVTSGWRVSVRLDGENEFRSYEVRRVARIGHTILFLEGA